jgi:hypothetical protein
LLHDDDTRLDPLTPEQKEQLKAEGITTHTQCSTWIRYYNSPRYKIWESDGVEKAYYEKVVIEEVK